MTQPNRTSFRIEAERIYGKNIDLQKLNRNVSWKLDIAAKQEKLASRLMSDRLKLTACPICRCEEFHIFVEVFAYPYCECTNCGHIFSQKPPHPDAIKGLYTADDKEKASVQAEVYTNKDLFALRVETIAKPKVKYVTERVPKKGKWVDFGCGVGEIVSAAEAAGWEAIGLESDPEETEFANARGINVKNVFISGNNIKEYVENAVVVSFFNILEHLLDPQEFLKAITSTIPKDAHVVIEVPRHPSISSFTNRTFPEMASRHIYSPDHLHVFTEKSIDFALKENDLLPQNIWLFGQDFYEMASSMVAKNNGTVSELHDEILKNSNCIQKAIDESELSDTMIIIAKKIK